MMPSPMNIRGFLTAGLVVLAIAVGTAAEKQPGPAPLKVEGENFVDPSGKVVKFWGVNLVSLYPEHALADKLADNLASLEVNLVRPHHNLRPSLDWSPKTASGALVQYNKGNSREFEPEALDRFDYLNAALRRNGIYLAFSANWTRRYLPGDFDILPGNEEERQAWQAAVKELMGWNWKKAFDVYKMLPVVDERAALLNEEFVRNLLTHENPFTGVPYAKDPQVLTFEIMNEGSFEYSVICGNRLPALWEAKLVEKWNAFAKAAEIEPGDLYKPVGDKAKEVRAKFLRQLDEDYLKRITAVIRDTGCTAPVTFSNLWRGENVADMNAQNSGWIEDHSYTDPMVVKSAEDGFYGLSRSAIKGKPFFVGELNQAEGEENVKRQSATRSMLPIATAAYASLQDWSGIVWFAWIHGDQPLGADGWARSEGRTSNIGQMVGDGMMIDHIRTAGMIFRRGLVEKSREPCTLWVDAPFTVADYEGLMRGKYRYKAGWQNIHGVRKAFGQVPEEQAEAEWMTKAPTNPLVSDTKQIVKDVNRRQLTVAAPQAEAFSGYLDKNAPAGLAHLALKGEGFSTIILVSDDGKSFEESSRLIMSRTALDMKGNESSGPQVALCGLQTPPEGKQWHVRLTRPRQAAELVASFGADSRPLKPSEDGSLALPAGQWNECEIFLSSSTPTPRSHEDSP